ncbi:MAG: PTS ascorbate transporter subunit IIC [Candidatus Hadarchaeum sp.]
MQALFKIWDVFFNQFMTKPQLLLAVVVAIGYILLKRPWVRVLTGAIKTAVGVMILQVGAGQLTSTFRPILFAVAERYNIKGTIIDPYAGLPAALDALKESSAWVGYTIMVAFALNVVLVLLKRWTKFRAVFLTGHIMFIQSALVTWLVKYYFNMGPAGTAILAGILVGLYWTIGSHILIGPTDKVTGGAGFTLGHQQMLMDWIASKIAPKFGDPKESTETLELPNWLSFVQDNIVSVGVLMTIFMGALMLSLGSAKVQQMAGTTHWLVHILLTGLSFAVNVTIILTGVRIFVAELAISFKGVSDRLLPGAVVGVDCPAVFPYAPNAVILGFLVTTIAQIVAVGILLLARSPILVIPGFVPLFFDGGTVGVYANAHGGWKATVVCCFILGLVQVFGSAWAISISGMTGGWMGNFDWATIWPAVGTVLRIIASILGTGPFS